uniref:Uncharacterized protein n=1 Tax=Cacopsylla melanoneura TaxID=428564 RepID=A0A8D8MD38_9HEMI
MVFRLNLYGFSTESVWFFRLNLYGFSTDSVWFFDRILYRFSTESVWLRRISFVFSLIFLLYDCFPLITVFLLSFISNSIYFVNEYLKLSTFIICTSFFILFFITFLSLHFYLFVNILSFFET